MPKNSFFIVDMHSRSGDCAILVQAKASLLSRRP